MPVAAAAADADGEPAPKAPPRKKPLRSTVTSHHSDDQPPVLSDNTVSDHTVCRHIKLLPYDQVVHMPLPATSALL